MIRVCSHPAHSSDVDYPTLLCTGSKMKTVGSCVQTGMDAMDCTVLSPGNSCYLIWLCSLTLFPQALYYSTTSLQVLTCYGSGEHVRSEFRGSTTSWSGISVGGGAPGTLPVGRSLVDYVIEGH